MNYICGDDREEIKIEIMDEYVQEDSEIRVIDKIVDLTTIQKENPPIL